MTPQDTKAPRGSSDPSIIEFEASSSRDLRLDKYLAGKLEDRSRTYLQGLVKRGLATVNGARVRPSYVVEARDRIRVVLEAEPDAPIRPENIPLDIIHEDESLLVINKPPYLVVHPGAGWSSGTLVHALAYHIGSLSQVAGNERPGIVHRLDKNTSGVMLVAKTDAAHHKLASQFERREVQKEYNAIAYGVMEFDNDVIQYPISRHRARPDRMQVNSMHGKPAMTSYEVIERFDGFTFVRLFPKTGRTHQLRVHLAAVRYPIVADEVYARRKELLFSEIRPRNLSEGNVADYPLMRRQALHARRIDIVHPDSGERVTFEAPLAPDFARVLSMLRKHAK